MIFFIFLIKISFSYNLYSFKNTSSIFLNRNAIYGPITLSKNITSPPIIISSNGSILFKDRCSTISIYKLNQYTSSDIFFSEIHEPYLLSKFSNQIKNLKRYFLAKWGIQISWKNHLINTKRTFNSFQMFLLSNEFQYFAIFNFKKISKEYDFFMGYHNSICQNVFKNSFMHLFTINSKNDPIRQKYQKRKRLGIIPWMNK